MRTCIILFLVINAIMRAIELWWLQRNKKSGTIHASWTLPVLGLGYAAMIVCSILEFVLIRRQVPLGAIIAGWGIILVRMPLKFWAARTLDRYWSPQIEIRDDHLLITSGPYRYLRHPAYFSVILDLIAVPLITGAYGTLATVSLALCGVILCRMYIEEQALLRRFGDAYRAYINDTFALFPVRKQTLRAIRKTLTLRSCRTEEQAS